MTDTETIDDLVFPETLLETNQIKSGLIGEVTELRSWVRLQYEGRKSGLRVDWDEVRDANDRIASLQGDIDALKKHASALREVDNGRIEAMRAQKEGDKRARAVIQKEIERQALAAKNDRRVASAELQARKETAAMTAVDKYLRDNAPDHVHAVRAVVRAARDATK